MTNQLFCYWLQGYFEISRHPNLTKEKVLLISGSLSKIYEPLGDFTQWLSNVISYFASQDYQQKLLDFFLPEIIQRLNLIFYHVIDNSYDLSIDKKKAQHIHDGFLDD